MSGLDAHYGRISEAITAIENDARGAIAAVERAFLAAAARTSATPRLVGLEDSGTSGARYINPAHVQRIRAGLADGSTQKFHDEIATRTGPDSVVFFGEGDDQFERVKGTPEEVAAKLGFEVIPAARAGEGGGW